MMNWNGQHASGWGLFAMSTGAGLGLVIIVGAVLLILRGLGRPAVSVHPAPTATVTTPPQLLAERFARGEIDEEEYQQRLAVLLATAPEAADSPGSWS